MNLGGKVLMGTNILIHRRVLSLNSWSIFFLHTDVHVGYSIKSFYHTVVRPPGARGLWGTCTYYTCAECCIFCQQLSDCVCRLWSHHHCPSNSRTLSECASTLLFSTTEFLFICSTNAYTYQYKLDCTMQIQYLYSPVTHIKIIIIIIHKLTAIFLLLQL